MRARPAVLVAALPAVTAVAGCTLLVDSGGLSGAEPDAAAATDATPDGENGAGDAGLTDGDAAGATTCNGDAPFGPVQLVPGLEQLDVPGITLTADETIAAFAILGDGGIGGTIYRATRTSRDDALQGLTALPLTGSTLTASPDGHALVFTGPARPYDLEASVLPPAAPPLAFAGSQRVTTIDTTQNEADPFLTSAALWFASTQGPGGTWRVYRAAGSGPDGFAQPTSFPELAAGASTTTYSDVGPMPTADERVLYFASNRAAPTYDVYVARRDSATAAFGAPSRVQELESAGDDVPRWLSADGCVMYLTSSRAGVERLFVTRKPK